MAKKIISLVIALAVVFSVATCALSASASCAITKPDAGISINLDKIKNLFDPSKWFPSKGDDTSSDVKDTVTEVTDKVQEAVDSATATDRKPIVDFYFDYDVIRELHWGISIGNVPESTTEVVTEPVVEEPATEAPTAEEEVSIVDEAPLAPTVEITDSAPLADVEAVANTGDAGIAALVALSAVSAAAFVVAKKK